MKAINFNLINIMKILRKNLLKKQKYSKKYNYNKKISPAIKCGNKGHYKNKCWSKAKINKLQISKDKNKIFKLNKIDMYISDKDSDSQLLNITDYSSPSDNHSEDQI